ncbi:MAG TPA: ABC transporter permease [Alphaproteobacteria bacterium]|nr:ABC transporter permease [Alphaproteobacteria bacterium]
MSRLGRAAVSASGLAGMLALWETVSDTGLANAALLPPPSTTLRAAWAIIASGQVLAPLGQSLSLLAAGYALASVLGIGLGLAMGCSRSIYGLFEPLVELLRPIPKAALVPPLFLFLGIGTTTMVTIITIGCFFPVLINTVQGVHGVDPVLLDTARTFRRSRGLTILEVILPAGLPMILTGMRVSLALGLILVVLAEMLAGSGGIGFLILDMQRSFDIVAMFAWLLIMALLGLILSLAFDILETRAVPWRAH